MWPTGSANTNGADPAQRLRNEAASQDIKVGRHREKLEMIRDSLRPFEAPYPVAECQQLPPNTVSQTDQQMSMVNALCQAGHDRQQAMLALQLVNYRSITAAAEILLNLNKDKDPRFAIMQNGNFYPLPNSAPPIQTSLTSSGYGSRMTSSSQSLHPNVYPSTSQMEDNDSSRSGSPSAPMRSPSPVRHKQQQPQQQLTPVQQQDYHRSHANIQLRQSYPGEEGYRTRTQFSGTPNRKEMGSGTTIVIEKAPSSEGRLRVSTSLNNGNSPRRLNSGREGIPVIKTRLDRPPPQTTKLHINVEPSHMDSSRRNAYRLDVISSEGTSSVSGVSGGVSGVQSILVDPDQHSTNPAFVNYVDQLCRRRGIDSLPGPSTSDIINNYMGHISPNSGTHRDAAEVNSATSVVRSGSPLPPSVEARLQNNSYESCVKPCQPRMFCFFMEQHVERIIQQHKERMKRSQQLSKEMEAAHLSENMKDQMLSFLIQKESRYMRLKRQKMDKEMFDMIKHIGVGAFGRVTLVKKKDTGQVYAMKTLLKKDVIMKQQAAHVKAERDILAEANSAWIVKLYFSFQDERCLYFIMEYVPGGDMMQLLINKGIFYEKLARFYIAELTCAIEYVHSLGFIHRDIKPDNILIDKDGHIKLTDFGLCTGLRWTHDRRYYGPDNEEGGNSHNRVDSFSLPPEVAHLEQQMKVLDIRHSKKRNQAHSVVGTGNYMAPEVIRKTGHTQLCDWWSVGVILYEMVFGRPPFMSQTEDAQETQLKIMNWPRYLDLSARAGGGHLSPECISLISQLCCETTQRLGKNKGAKEIKKHPWFRSVDFNTLRAQKAEFVPRVEHAEDTRNFDTIEVTESPFETLGKRAPNNPAFFEFTFRHFFDYDGQGCPSLRPIKRPSLAPLMENGHSSASSSGVHAATSTVGHPTHPSIPQPLPRRAPMVPGHSMGNSMGKIPTHNSMPYHDPADSDESFIV